MKTNIFVAVLIIALVGSMIYSRLEESDRKYMEEQRVADEESWAKERLWKDPVVKNCVNTIRKSGDPTLSFDTYKDPRYGFAYTSHYMTEKIEKTDSGYVLHMWVSSAATGGRRLDILCYTDLQGQALRLVPGS